MGKTEKLIEALKSGSISAKGLRTLLGRLGWLMDREAGSHEQWLGPQGQRMTIATHSKDLKPYQIKEAREKLL